MKKNKQIDKEAKQIIKTKYTVERKIKLINSVKLEREPHEHCIIIKATLPLEAKVTLKDSVDIRKYNENDEKLFQEIMLRLVENIEDQLESI